MSQVLKTSSFGMWAKHCLNFGSFQIHVYFLCKCRGNHSQTQFPDVAHGSIVSASGKLAGVLFLKCIIDWHSRLFEYLLLHVAWINLTVRDAVKDDAYLNDSFIKTVQVGYSGFVFEFISNNDYLVCVFCVLYSESRRRCHCGMFLIMVNSLL